MSYYVCPNCGMKMKDYWKLRKHIVEKHGKEKTPGKNIQQIPVIAKRK